MKAILMSIKPKYVSMILNGEKTIEIRTKFPKDYVGWVYIYCTKDNKQRLYPVALLDKSNHVFKRAYREDKIDNRTNYLNGKVVARFWCDNVEEIEHYCCDDIYEGYHREDYGTKTLTKEELLKCSCLRECELVSYLSYNKNGELYGYAIHISQLEIFDEPKEISEFSIKVFPHRKDNLMTRYLTRAPQSWYYIEV